MSQKRSMAGLALAFGSMALAALVVVFQARLADLPVRTFMLTASLLVVAEYGLLLRRYRSVWSPPVLAYFVLLVFNFGLVLEFAVMGEFANDSDQRLWLYTRA